MRADRGTLSAHAEPFARRCRQEASMLAIIAAVIFPIAFLLAATGAAFAPAACCCSALPAWRCTSRRR